VARERDAEAQEINRIKHAEFEALHRAWQTELKAYESKRTGKQKTEDIGPPPEQPSQPHLPRFTVGDVTVERLIEILGDSPRGLLMLRDELAALLGGFDRYGGGKGGAERSIYLSLYNAEPAQNDRKLDNRKSVTLKSPHLSIFGGIQPELLHRVLSDDDMAAGLAGRFLFAMPPATQKKWNTPAILVQLANEATAMFRDLYAIGESVSWNAEPLEAGEQGDLQHATLPLTHDADRLFGEFYEAHHDHRSDLHGPARAAWPKLVAYCGRLALAVQLINDPNSTAVDDDSVSRAIRLAKWFANEALRIYALRDESEHDREQRQLVAVIQSKGGAITARDLQRGPQQYRKSGEAEAALNRLVDAGLGEWKIEDTAGRSKRVFTLLECGDGDRSLKDCGTSGLCHRRMCPN